MKQLTRIFLGLALMGAAGLASAQSMNVSANVSASCTVGVATNLDFGTYDPTSVTAKNEATAGQVTAKCVRGASYRIELGQGGNAAGGSTCASPARRMSDGAGTPSYLSYALYQDGARTTAWGCDTTNAYVYAASNNATQTFNVYGQITAGQDVPAGSFTDTVAVTYSVVP